MALAELYAADRANTIVFSGGTDAPVSGTQETWLVASSAMFGAASAGVSQFHVADPVAATEIIAVTNVSSTTWTVTRGSDGTTPVAHAEGFAVYQVVPAGFLASPVFSGAVSTGGLTGATAASRYVGATASGAPISGTFAVGDFVIDQTGKIQVCTTAGTPGTWAGVGGVSSLTAADTSVVVGGSGGALTVRTGTLDVIAADHPPAGDWSNSSHKITSLADGSGAQDAAAYGQTPAGGNTVTIGQGGTGQTTRQAAINALAGTQTAGYVLGSDGTNIAMVPDGGVTIKVPAPTGLTATDTPHVTAAVTSLITALGSGPATLLFQDGTYQIDSNSAVIRSVSNFAVKGTGGTVISQAPNRSGAANNVGGDLFVIADCTDFRVEGITFDGLRDTVAPMTPLSASASSGQPSVTVAAGQGSRYMAGQRLFLFGGLGTSEQNQSEGFAIGSGTPLVVSSITPGGGSGGGDLITFTANLANSYAQISSTAFSDGFGPYAYAGAYLTPYQTGSNTVAGRTLKGEDQQNGLHLLSCARFTVTQCTGRNLWESGVKLGTGYETSSLTDGCTQGDITDCIAHHGYDQGISVWVSQNINVKGCITNAAGWAGISLTASDYCTVTGNQTLNSIYRVPGDVASGSGIVTEGGVRNQIKGNIATGHYQYGIQAIHSPMQWGVGGGYPTLSTFVEAGTAAGTSIQVSSTSTMEAGGLYSILDGSRTEYVTVATIVDSAHVKFADQIEFSHASGIFIGRRIAQENVIEGNSVRSCGASGIYLVPSVRSVVKNNTVSGYANVTAGSPGISMDFLTGSPYLPAGVTLGGDAAHIEGNVIGNGQGAAIRAQGVSRLQVRGNRIYSPMDFGGGIELHGITDSVIECNQVTDIISSFGIVIENGGPSSTACARLTVSGNIVRRTSGHEGISVQGGDSLTITGNQVSACGGTAGINLLGLTSSLVGGNVANSNQGAGINIGDNGAVHSQSNRLIGNTCREDGSGYNVATGATYTQQHGITESGSSNNNLFTGNECDANAVDQLTTAGAASYAWANIISGAPSGNFPASLLPLDGTAADIAPLGAQATGATAKLADAGHVHPVTGLLPATVAQTGLVAWNYPSFLASAQSGVITAGTVYLLRIPLAAVSVTVTNILIAVNTAGNTLTSSENFIGLFDNTGARIGVSADQTVAWGTPGLKTAALVSGPFTGSWPFVYVAFVSNGTTAPLFERAAGATIGSSLVNLSASGSAIPFATNGTGTALPSSLTYSSNSGGSGQSIWCGLS